MNGLATKVILSEIQLRYKSLHVLTRCHDSTVTLRYGHGDQTDRAYRWQSLAATHSPDSAEAGLPSGEDRPTIATDRCRSDQEFGLRVTRAPTIARRLSVGANGDRRRWRRRFHLRSGIRRRPHERRARESAP